ncbi:MAG: sensor histidine kinase [Candidatus Krumholzibacteriia bacterium]
MSGLDRTEDARLGEDLEFFGQVTASVTHQINNVLSVVAELNGLLDDLARAAGEDRPVAPQKLADVAGRIQRQVERGVGYVDRLNEFAHAVDEPRGPVDLTAAVSAVEALAQRMAVLRRAELSCTVPAEPVTVTSRGFRVLRVIYRGVELALAGGGRGRSVQMALQTTPGTAKVVIGSSDPLDAASDSLELQDSLLGLAGDLGVQADVEPGAAAGGARITLRWTVGTRD